MTTKNDDLLDEILVQFFADRFDGWHRGYDGAGGQAYKKAKAQLVVLIANEVIKELRKVERLTHEGRGTILWEMDAIATTLKKRINQLQATVKEKK